MVFGGSNVFELQLSLHGVSFFFANKAYSGYSPLFFPGIMTVSKLPEGPSQGTHCGGRGRSGKVFFLLLSPPPPGYARRYKSWSQFDGSV